MPPSRGFSVPMLVALVATSPILLAQGDPRVQFEDVTAMSGLLAFEHFSYTYGGDGLAGVAWLDYNNDGLLDLYFTNGKDIVGEDQDGFDNALFENRGDGTFVNVAVAKGVTNGRGSAGVVAADIDNDGDQDLFLTGDGGLLGHDQVSGIQTIDSGVTLFVNNGAPDYDYTQADMHEVGLVGFETTMSAAMADVDGDGWLDLFVTASGTRPEGCIVPPPCDQDDPTTKLHKSRLYLNRTSNGPIRFLDVTDASGIGASLQGALATAFTDYTLDGRMDLLVANGVTIGHQPNTLQLYRNDGWGIEEGSVIFTDVSADMDFSRKSGWMSISPGDFDNDTGIDFFAANVGGSQRARHGLLRWFRGSARFEDVSSQVGLWAPGPQTTPSTWFGWGSTAQDFDHDGRLDLFFVGAPPPLESTQRWNPGTLLLNEGPLIDMVDQSEFTGVDLTDRYTSGLAGGDFDNDGRVDVVVATDNYELDLGHPVLLRNVTPGDNRWITLRLTGNGVDTNRDAVGARVAVIVGQPPNQGMQLREIHAGSGFLSTDSKWVTFGLGPLAPTATVQVGVDWPSGSQQVPQWETYGPFAVDQIVDIVQE